MRRLLLAAALLAGLPAQAQSPVGQGGGTGGVTIGTTAITGGAASQLLYDNAGVVGEIVKANSSVLVTNSSGVASWATTLPNINIGTPTAGIATNLTGTAPGLTVGNVTGTGAASATSLALGGATIGSNALAVTGTSAFSGVIAGAVGGDTPATASYSFGSGANVPYTYASGSTIGFGFGTNATHEVAVGYLSGTNKVPITGPVSVVETDSIQFNYNSGGPNVGLRGNAGNLLAITNGTTAVGLEVFSTATSTTNYESGLFDWTTSANVLTMGTQVGGGGGTARDVSLVTGGVEALRIKATTQNVQFGAISVLKAYTVDTLPTGVTGGQVYVTDAVACTFLATPVHNGSVVCPVFYNGSAWVGG